jgi:hypothetical protein
MEVQLIERRHAELASIGWPVERLAASIGAAAAVCDWIHRMGLNQGRQVTSEILGQHGEVARRKVFFRRDVMVSVAPHLYGQDARLVEALAERAIADPETVPLIGMPGARERPLHHRFHCGPGGGHRRVPGSPDRPQRRPCRQSGRRGPGHRGC